MPEYNPKDPTKWLYTVNAREEFGDTFKDRHLIGRDTPIKGGVYYGVYGGEAIVVDPDKYPEEYDQLLDQVIEKSRETSLGVFFDAYYQRLRALHAGEDALKIRHEGRFGARKVRIGRDVFDGIGLAERFIQD